MYDEMVRVGLGDWAKEVISMRLKWYGYEFDSRSTQLFKDPGHTVLQNCAFDNNRAGLRGGAFSLAVGTTGFKRSL